MYLEAIREGVRTQSRIHGGDRQKDRRSKWVCYILYKEKDRNANE